VALTDVRIVDLPPMRVASALGYGRHPEDEAVRKIDSFARRIGVRPGSPGHRIFGFNNPNPSPGSPNYGYESWLVVGTEVEAEPPIEIKRIPGGTYAVTRCVGLEHIGERWRALSAWVEDSPYKRSPHGPRCLEEALSHGEPDTTKWVFDLYIDIAA